MYRIQWTDEVVNLSVKITIVEYFVKTSTLGFGVSKSDSCKIKLDAEENEEALQQTTTQIANGTVRQETAE